MRYGVQIRVGLLAVAFHLAISFPFFFVGPMLAIPSHGGVIGWAYSIPEFPTFCILRLAGGLCLIGWLFPPSNVMGQFSSFVALGVLCWFFWGFAVSLLWSFVATRFRRNRPRQEREAQEPIGRRRQS